MKRTGKFMALMMSAVVLLSGCGSKTPDIEPSGSPVESSIESSVESTDVTTPESSETIPEESSSEEPSFVVVPNNDPLVIADNAVDFAANMRMGWNLGNTLDATGGNGLSSETSWGQPLVTQELMNYIHEVGFTSIRIPVSWGKHTSGDDYTIDSEWMDRVNEIVDWALDANLYVIINSHHDNDYYYPTEENFDNASHYLTCIWTQIADRFKDYDERLVFESMNEPRLAGTSIEWWFASTNEDGCAAIEIISRLNQVFVDTVRAGEGYNQTRYIGVPSYAASPDFALNKAFTVPTDPAEKLLISIHAYTPYDFTMNTSGYSTWDGSKDYEFNFMDKLYKTFVSKGYGVYIGEMGCTNKGNLEDRVAWAKGYTEKAISKKISCFVWDNGGTAIGEENFGLIGRIRLTPSFPELLDAYMENYYK